VESENAGEFFKAKFYYILTLSQRRTLQIFHLILNLRKRHAVWVLKALEKGFEIKKNNGKAALK
jgi:hypothetical protein